MHSLRCNKLAASFALCLMLLSAVEANAEPQQATGAASSVAGSNETQATKDKTLKDLNKPYGSHLSPILETIKADTVQRQKITAVVESYRAKIEPMRQELRKRREEFLNCITTSTSAETTMQKQVELGHVSSDLSSTYTLMRLQIRKVLRPDQIVLYEKYCRTQGWIK